MFSWKKNCSKKQYILSEITKKPRSSSEEEIVLKSVMRIPFYLNYSSTYYSERKLSLFLKEMPSKRIMRQLHLTDVNEVNLLRIKDKVRAPSRPL